MSQQPLAQSQLRGGDLLDLLHTEFVKSQAIHPQSNFEEASSEMIACKLFTEQKPPQLAQCNLKIRLVLVLFLFLLCIMTCIKAISFLYSTYALHT